MTGHLNDPEGVNGMDRVTIVHGVPPDQLGAAADLYAEAFAHYFAVTARVRTHCWQIIADGMRAESAFAALSHEKELLGVAGYQHDGQVFLQVSLKDLVGRLGWFHGVVGGVLLSYLDRPNVPGQLVMDGIAVARSARGQGVGTLLLEAVVGYAARRGLREVRLDVVDTNPAARRLYERVGFVEVGRSEVPEWFARRVGFRSSATLVRSVRAVPTAEAGAATERKFR